MQKFSGTCSPDQLHMLQSVFDQIWMELRENTNSSYSGPSNPDDLRDEIARRVLNGYDGDGTASNEIIRQVLASFGIDRPLAPPQIASKRPVSGKDAR